MPARETFAGAMIIFGGALLLAPGFITDVFGFALLLPPSRALVRGVIARLAKRRISVAWIIPGGGPGRGGPGAGRPGPSPQGGRTYDYEGTAHEVDDPQGELPGGRGDG